MRLRRLILLFWVLITVPGYALNRQEADVVFEQANTAYREADYQQAAKYYEQILDGGWESGALFYNLGSSYFREGDLGKTILNYERARRLIPRDQELTANYRYACSLRKPGADDRLQTWISHFLRISSDLLSMHDMIWFLFLILILLGCGHGLYLFGFLSRKFFRGFFVGLSVIWGILLFSLIGNMIHNNQRAVILTESQARFEPRPEATAHFDVVPGQTVKITGQEAQWVKIKRVDGKRGWVPKDALEKI